MEHKIAVDYRTQKLNNRWWAFSFMDTGKSIVVIAVTGGKLGHKTEELALKHSMAKTKIALEKHLQENNGKVDDSKFVHGGTVEEVLEKIRHE